MIPTIDILTEEITEIQYPSKSYKIDNKTYERINGYVDELEAITQTVYIILQSERYMFPIYSWDYGVELVDLIGQPTSYVLSEIPRRITEALTTDNRIEDVIDFEFEIDKSKVHTTFTVVTVSGDIPMTLEVDI